jgi:hypothetical protein
MAKSWTVLENIDHAAALRAYGFRVMSDKGEATASGKQWARWSACLDDNNLIPASTAGVLVRAIKQSELDKIDAAHPILDYLGVLKLRHQLVDAVKNGTHYRIDLAQSEYGAVMVRGDEPPASHAPPYFKTGDLKLAACMIRLGLPLLRIEGTSPNSTLLLAGIGYKLGGDPANYGTLATKFRAMPRDSWAFPAPQVDATLDPILNRLRSLMHVLWVRDRLHDYINGRVQNLIVQSPFNQRQVLMPENADGKTIDKCRKFLHIP